MNLRAYDNDKELDLLRYQTIIEPKLTKNINKYSKCKSMMPSCQGYQYCKGHYLQLLIHQK